MIVVLIVVSQAVFVHAEDTADQVRLIDRVVAFIDDTAITLVDYQKYYQVAKKFHPGLSPEEAINTLINRMLLIREARRLRLKGETEDEIINHYIDIRIRAFVRVSEAEVRGFYEKNRERFGSAKLQELYAQIDTLLREKKVNSMLKRHLKELKRGSYIKVNYIPRSGL